jgi:hypothetical protein
LQAPHQTKCQLASGVRCGMCLAGAHDG